MVYEIMDVIKFMMIVIRFDHFFLLSNYHRILLDLNGLILMILMNYVSAEILCHHVNVNGNLHVKTHDYVVKSRSFYYLKVC